MLDADHPITESQEDRLNRTPFAKSLARCMLDHQNPESLVVGLYGGWGVGKTSVINLTLEELTIASNNLLDEEKPIIINFSAWSYSGEQQLIARFFRRLIYALSITMPLPNKAQIIYLLESYATFFGHDAISKATPSVPMQNSWLEKFRYFTKQKKYAWEQGQDITHIKAELNALLHQQQHKIIIIIDNISRLYDHEIKQIFQIVKSMANYSNTLYLLAFDKDQVIRVINEMDGEGGEELVEKIVQLPFTVPPILQQDLEGIFADRINHVVSKVPEEAWNSEYFADIYNNALKFFFHHCRDITRYVNILDFSYMRVRDVVNPVDFFALTAIEVFLPAIYFGIRENKDLFTDLLDKVYELNETEIEKEKRRVTEILSREKRFSPPIILNLLLQLFPRLRHLYKPKTTFYYSDTIADKLKRICSPNWFDAYFRLSMQAGQLPDAEFKTVLTMAANEQSFDQALNRLNQDNCIIKFLNQLDNRSIIESLPRDDSQTIISTLLDNGDLFPLGVGSVLSLDTPTRIHRIIHTLLARFDKHEERFSLLQNAIAKATKSIYISVHELNAQAHEHREETDDFLPMTFRDLMPEQLQSLQKLTASRIAHWANNKSLDEYPHLIEILSAWLAWGNQEECRKYIVTLTKTDRGLLAFLTAILDKAIAQAMASYVKNPAWRKYVDDIGLFISPNALIAHAKLLFEDPFFEKLREREQLALMIFLDLLKTDTNKIIPQTTPDDI